MRFRTSKKTGKIKIFNDFSEGETRANSDGSLPSNKPTNLLAIQRKKGKRAKRGKF